MGVRTWESGQPSPLPNLTPYTSQIFLAKPELSSIPGVVPSQHRNHPSKTPSPTIYITRGHESFSFDIAVADACLCHWVQSYASVNSISGPTAIQVYTDMSPHGNPLRQDNPPSFISARFYLHNDERHSR